ncbi:CDP-alcohol phosphatidyltransferase family protein [Dethiobacter alkaliphilus]|uniref:CDP-alcohol phosphatidyltransferase family protein n=1 Tax=Dethiobacter alkaliphilus TaxID=427926 RepID=UPI0022278AA2|nr:CDP-alcohol phosphatidyltransferase family protein [Dethiobacter alkaliphilus]MCW3488825.1 CDP-alcohol phosphatidyltransferase family protein [Dethiobacter alkaliphilus]
MDIEKYRKLCQKNESENYLLDKLIFRKISIYVTILFIKLGIKPNQATFISLIAALGSLYFLLFNTTAMLLTASALIFTYYILDHVDGELARYYIQTGQMQPSLKGHYFDVLVHRYSSNLMVFFMSLSIYNLYGYELAVLLGFLACIGISSFPNVVAAHVIVGKIANNKNLIFEDAAAQDILSTLETKSQQIKDIHHGSTIQKLKKLIIESLFFPGHVVLLVLILIGDAFLGDFAFLAYPFNLRVVFLLGIVPLYTLKTVIQSILWLNKFSKVA